MGKIYLAEFDENAFFESIRSIINEELSNHQRALQSEKLLSPSEVCKLFIPNISKVTLYNWTKQGKLIKQTIGRKVFYKYSDVMNSLKVLRRHNSTL